MTDFRKYSLVPFRDENTEAVKKQISNVLNDKHLQPHEQLALVGDMRQRIHDYKSQVAPPVVEARRAEDEKSDIQMLKELLANVIELLTPSQHTSMYDRKPNRFSPYEIKHRKNESATPKRWKAPNESTPQMNKSNQNFSQFINSQEEPHSFVSAREGDETVESRIRSPLILKKSPKVEAVTTKAPPTIAQSKPVRARKMPDYLGMPKRGKGKQLQPKLWKF